jgi:hypothetical protein
VFIKIKSHWDRVVPRPAKVVQSEGHVELGEGWGLIGGDAQIRQEWIDTFRLSPTVQDKNVTLSLGVMNPEAYEVSIEQENLKVVAGSQVGLGHALKTLFQFSPDGRFPQAKIEDAPSLKMRGFHINFDSFRQMDMDEARYVLNNAAKLRLNTILFEYSNRFPYQKHARIKAPTALSTDNVTELLGIAKANGLDVIPLQQSIGHLDYLLQHDHYACIREEEVHKDQVCPLHPDSFRIFAELAEEVLSLHPGIKHFHIGGDEARRMGTCPRCKEEVERRGVSRLYVDYINRVSQWLKDRDVTPIIWDDMLCSHPEALDDLDRNIIIMYWEYWTTSKSSPYFIARYDRSGKPVTIYDKGWDSTWNDELSDLERTMMKNFGTAVPLEESLGEDFLSVYGPYLGEEFPKRIKGYPYLEFYQDKGFKVIGAPTTLGNGDCYHTLPNYWRFIPNIKTVCERCLVAGAEGVITTAWYNYVPVMFHLGMAATAQFAWGLPEWK